MLDGNIYTGELRLEFGGYRSQGTPYRLNIDIVGQDRWLSPGAEVELQSVFERIDGKPLDIKPESYTWTLHSGTNSMCALIIDNNKAIIKVDSEASPEPIVVQVTVLYMIEETGTSTEFTEYLPIGFSLIKEDRCRGPNRVVYDMYGDLSYDKQAYAVYGSVSDDSYIPLNWEIYNWDGDTNTVHTLRLGRDDNYNTLRPAASILANSDTFFEYVVAKDSGDNIRWVQPIVTIRNRWNDETLNKWPGGKVSIEEQYILSPYMAAGSKDGDNSFTGVVLGAEDDVWGLYGYNSGVHRFCFTQKGEGYIGTPGSHYIQLSETGELDISIQNFNLSIPDPNNNQSYLSKIIADSEGLEFYTQKQFQVISADKSSYIKLDSLGSKLEIKTQHFDLQAGNNSIIANDDGLSVKFTEDFELINEYTDADGNKVISSQLSITPVDGLQIKTQYLEAKVGNNNEIVINPDGIELKLLNKDGTGISFNDGEFKLQTNEFSLSAGGNSITGSKTNGMKLKFVSDFTIQNDLNNYIKFDSNNELAIKADIWDFRSGGNSYICTSRGLYNSADYPEFAIEDCEIEGTILKSYNGAASSGAIPSKITQIGDGAFFREHGNAVLKEVFIPEGVEIIGGLAFSRCVSISTLVVPRSVTSIGTDAFSNMHNLHYIEFASMANIPSRCCQYSNLQTIILHEGITTIGDEAFSGYHHNGFQISIPLSVISIGSHAFGDNLSQIEVYYEGNEEDWHAIDWNNIDYTKVKVYYNQQLESRSEKQEIELNLSNSVSVDGDYVETSYIRFVDGELSLKPQEFKLQVGNNSIIATKDGLSLKFKDNFAIEDENNDKNYIKFEKDNNNTQLAISSTSFNFQLGESYIRSHTDDIVQYTELNLEDLEQGNQTITGYKDSIYWPIHATLPTQDDNGYPIIGIERAAFSHAPMQYLYIPDSYVFIEQQAFAYSGLCSLVIPSNIRQILYDAFCYNSQLTYVEFAANSVSIIPSSCFEGCASLQTIVLHEGITKIDIDAFALISPTATIYLPQTIQYLNEDAFSANEKEQFIVCYAGTEEQWFSNQYLDYFGGQSKKVKEVRFNTPAPVRNHSNIDVYLANTTKEDGETIFNSSFSFIEGLLNVRTKNLLLATDSFGGATFNLINYTSDGSEQSYIKFDPNNISIKTNSFDLNTPNLRLTDEDVEDMVVQYRDKDGEWKTRNIWSQGLTILDDDQQLRIKIGHVDHHNWTDTNTQEVCDYPVYGMSIYDGSLRVYGENPFKPLLWLDGPNMYLRGRLANADEYDIQTYLVLGPTETSSGSGVGMHLYTDNDGFAVKALTIAPDYYNSERLYLEFQNRMFIGTQSNRHTEDAGIVITANGGSLQGQWNCEVYKMSIPNPDEPTDQWVEIFYGTGHISNSSGLVIRGKCSGAIDQNSTARMVLDGITLKGYDTDIMINTHGGTQIHTIDSNGHNTLILYDGTYYYKPVRQGDRSIGSNNINYMTATYNTDFKPTANYIHVEASGGGGNWGSARGIPTYDSDRRLKFNIQDTQIKGLPIIRQLRHVEFQWKANQGYVKNGFIAQEMEEIIPDAVLSVPQPDGSDIKQLLTHNILPYATKAIQELDEKIIELENQIQELKSQLNF